MNCTFCFCTCFEKNSWGSTRKYFVRFKNLICFLLGPLSRFFLSLPPICGNTLIYEGCMRVLKGQGKKLLSKLLAALEVVSGKKMAQVASALKKGRENWIPNLTLTLIPAGKLKGKQAWVPWIDWEPPDVPQSQRLPWELSSHMLNGHQNLLNPLQKINQHQSNR